MDPSKDRRDFHVRFACTQGWFLRACWNTKLQFILALIEAQEDIHVHLQVLSVIEKGATKDVLYGDYSQTSLWDLVPQDDDRGLYPQTLTFVMLHDQIWYTTLERDHRVRVLTGLLRLGGGALVRRALDAIITKLDAIIAEEERLRKEEENERKGIKGEGKKKKKKSRGKKKSKNEKESMTTESDGPDGTKSGETEDKEEKKMQEVEPEVENEFIQEYKAKLVELEKKLKGWDPYGKVLPNKTGSEEESTPDKKSSKTKEKQKSGKKSNDSKNQLDVLQTLPIWNVKYIAQILSGEASKKIKNTNSYWRDVMQEIQKEKQMAKKLADKVSILEAKTIEHVSIKKKRSEAGKKRKRPSSLMSVKSVKGSKGGVRKRSKNRKGNKKSKGSKKGKGSETEKRSESRKGSEKGKRNSDSQSEEEKNVDVETMIEILQFPVPQNKDFYKEEYCVTDITTNFFHSRVVASDASGNIFAASTLRNTISLYSFENGSQAGPALRGHTGMVTCLCFHPDGGTLFSGSADLTVRCWDAVKAIRVYRGFINPPTCLSVNENLLATGSSDKLLRVFHIWSAQLLCCLNQEHTISCVHIDLNTPSVFSGNHGGEITVYKNYHEPRLTRSSATEGHKGEIQTMLVSKHIFLTGGEDGLVKIWRKKEPMFRLMTLYHKSPVCSVSVAEFEIFSGCANGYMKIWNIWAGSPIDAVKVSVQDNPLKFILCSRKYKKIVIAAETYIKLLDFCQSKSSMDHITHTECHQKAMTAFSHIPAYNWSIHSTEGIKMTAVLQLIRESQYHSNIRSLMVRNCTHKSLREKKFPNEIESLITNTLREEPLSYDHDFTSFPRHRTK